MAAVDPHGINHNKQFHPKLRNTIRKSTSSALVPTTIRRAPIKKSVEPSVELSIKRAPITKVDPLEVKEDPCPQLYDPCTREPISSLQVLEKRIRELKAHQNTTPVGLYGLTNTTSNYEFLTTVFIDKTISLDDMVSFKLSEGRNPGSDIYEVLCRLFVFFGGIAGVNPRINGNYKFMQQIESKALKIYNDSIDALQQMECVATSKMGISDITLINVRADKKAKKPDDPYCEVSCDTTDSETVKTYLMSVKWYKEEKNAEHYDLEKLFATARIRTTPEQNPLDIIVFLKSKKDFQIAHNRSYRQYTQHLAKTFYGWHEDVKPFLQEIRRQIFEYADTLHITPLETIKTQYLTTDAKPVLSLQLHQDIIVHGVCNQLSEVTDDKRYLIGVLPRGGKTYIAGGIIRQKMIDTAELNILWLTAAPTETVTQVRDDLLATYEDFKDVEFIDATKSTKKTKRNTVFFCSTQLLVTSQKSKFFKELFIKSSQTGIVFFDEAHKTGTGSQTKGEIEKIMSTYEEFHLPFIFLTATYYTILLDYQLHPSHTFIWDYTDVLSARALATDTEQDKAVQKLQERFGKDLVTDVIIRRTANGETLETMAKAYIGFPDLYFISADFQTEVIQRFEEQGQYDSMKGFSLGAIFGINPTSTIADVKTAQNTIRKDAYKIFANLTNPKNMISLITPRDQFNDPEIVDIPGGEPLVQTPYVKGRRPIDPSILGRINNMSSDTKSRFRLDEHPSLLMFMPTGGQGTNIFYLLCAWASLLMTHTWWRENYEIACVVSEENMDSASIELSLKVPTDRSNGIHIISKHVKTSLLQLERSLHCRPQPKGLLILAGQMLSMGISLPCTDVVFLLNETKSPDDIIQKMYRALTPSSGKTSAFVVDLNPVRTVAALYGYTKASHSSLHQSSEILDIIYNTYSWDSDVFEYSFAKGLQAQPLVFQKRLEELFQKAELDPEYRVQDDVTGLQKRVITNIRKGIDKEFVTALKGTFSNEKIQTFFTKIGLKDVTSTLTKNGTLVISRLIQPKDEPIEKPDKIEIIIDNFIDTVIEFIKYIALTSSTDDFDQALVEFESNEVNNHGTSLYHNTMQLIAPSITNIQRDKHIVPNLLLGTIKDFAYNSSKSIFREMKGKIDKHKLRKDKILELIHKRLTPTQKRKADFGEVFTPIELIEELLVHVPNAVWSNPDVTWLDPASGIGNFLIVIFYKLDEGLKTWEPSDTKRRKHIIEKMLYMVEIQSSNNRIARDIFISLCPSSTPNIWTIDSLTIPTKLKGKGWPITFDMIVGNPPFQNGRNMQFYVSFIDMAYQLLKPNGYLVYVIPNKILIPNKANESITQFNPLRIYHTVNERYFPSIATTICALIAKKETYKRNTLLIFKNGEMRIDIDIPTPTQYNDIALKHVSDKILVRRQHYLTATKDKPHEPHVYISRVWVRYSPDKPKGGSHVFAISDEPTAKDDGSGKYIIIPKTITKATLIWYLSRSEVMRFITKIYAGAMNVPAFIWDILPSISLQSKDDASVYQLLHLTKADQEIIRATLDDSIEEPQEGGSRFRKTRKATRL